jgi:hypothetical protein
MTVLGYTKRWPYRVTSLIKARLAFKLFSVVKNEKGF